MNYIEGKYISILGASTSTFSGFSNNSEYNSTLGGNAAYYPKAEYLNDVKSTWWMRVIDDLGLNLCVNNSYSGSCVSTFVDGAEKAGCMLRATELHNDKLCIEPDIIILIIGGNDALRGYETGEYRGIEDIYDEKSKTYIGNCNYFGPAYATMVHKVKSRYPKADIYVCSMLHWETKKHDRGLLEYNNVIQKIAEELQLTYVDFYNQTAICPESAQIYLHTDGIHPNKYGFEQMSDCIVRILTDKYK